MSSGPEYASIPDLIAAFRGRKLSPVELLQAQLGRIREHNPAVNAFALLDEERALAADAGDDVDADLGGDDDDFDVPEFLR